MTKEREEKVFDEKMSGKGVQADLSRSRKNGQTRLLSNETSEQREERLAAQRKWAAVKRSNERSEQTEERVAAQRKRAAVKRCNESSKGREERSRAERGGSGTQSRRDSDNRRRNQRDAIFAARRILAQPRMGWPWKSRFALRRVGSRRDGGVTAEYPATRKLLSRETGYAATQWGRPPLPLSYEVVF